MSRPAADADLVEVLRSFVSGTEPLLNALRIPTAAAEDQLHETDRRGFRQRAAAALGSIAGPGSAVWRSLSADERASWWVDRVGALTASLVSASGLVGIVADRASLQPVLSAAGRGLVLCAMAHEHGVVDRDVKVQLLAAVLFNRALTPSTLLPAHDADRKELASAVIGDLGEPRQQAGITALGQATWRLGRSLLGLRDALESVRGPRSRRGLGKIPVVGAVRGFVDERAALRETAATGSAWIANHFAVSARDAHVPSIGRLALEPDEPRHYTEGSRAVALPKGSRLASERQEQSIGSVSSQDHNDDEMRPAKMGFFKKRRAEQAAAARPAPVIVGDDDLARAGQVLHQFEQAVGSDPALRAAVLAIAQAGGAPSLEQALRQQMDTSNTGLDRPWRWLTAVAREAQRRGELALVAHLVLFVSMWTNSYEPHLMLADRLDMRLESPPRGLLGEIYSVALMELPNLDPAAIVVDHHTGRIDVEGLLKMCAVSALKLEADLVEPLALARAQAVIDG